LRKNENNQNKIKALIEDRNNKENIIRNKAASNIRNLKYLTKPERDKKQLEDIIMASQIDSKISYSKDKSKNSIPDKYELSQNYPNPFNPVTKINFVIPKQSLTVLKVYDVLGREITKLVNEVKQSGRYSIDFDGSNLSSGVYFYKLESGTFSDVKRMVLIK
jgi:hypothetical protein